MLPQNQTKTFTTLSLHSLFDRSAQSYTRALTVCTSAESVT